MAKTKKKPKSVQLGIRFDAELIDQITNLAKWEEVDKNTWIKQVVSSAVQDSMDEMMDQLNEDFIKARIDEDLYLELSDKKKVPADIKEARQNRLKLISESEV